MLYDPEDRKQVRRTRRYRAVDLHVDTVSALSAKAMAVSDPDLDRAFPYQVEITIPEPRTLLIMQGWCTCKRYRTRMFVSSSETPMRWCFAEKDDAQSFQAAFGGTIE